METTKKETKMKKFSAVHVGDIFECVKANGKRYAGMIQKVASYPRGTLVTICYPEPDAVKDHMGQWHNVQSPAYRSIYLEDCVSWDAETPLPY